MKKFLKYFSVYMAVAMVLISTICFPSVGAFASSDYWASDMCEFISPEYPGFDGNGTFTTPYEGVIYCNVIYGPSAGLLDSTLQPTISVGEYHFSGIAIPDSLEGNGVPVIRALGVHYVDGSMEVLPFGAFYVTEEVALIVVCSFNKVPTVTSVPEKGLYHDAFDMFADFFYGEDAVLTAEQNMVLTILGTLSVLFVVVVPFLIVFMIIRLCCRW